jgi:hypothetical protein
MGVKIDGILDLASLKGQALNKKVLLLLLGRILNRKSGLAETEEC